MQLRISPSGALARARDLLFVAGVELSQDVAVNPGGALEPVAGVAIVVPPIVELGMAPRIAVCLVCSNADPAGRTFFAFRLKGEPGEISREFGVLAGPLAFEVFTQIDEGPIPTQPVTLELAWRSTLGAGRIRPGTDGEACSFSVAIWDRAGP